MQTRENMFENDNYNYYRFFSSSDFHSTGVWCVLDKIVSHLDAYNLLMILRPYNMHNLLVLLRDDCLNSLLEPTSVNHSVPSPKLSTI